jgi:bla regulator protein BlaR1
MTPWSLPALLVHLWQSTLFVVLVCLATRALRRNGARLRYWLWTGASVKFLVPLSVLVSLGERFQWREAPAAVQPAVSFVMQDVLTPAAIVVAAPVSAPPSIPLLPWVLLGVWGVGALVVLVSWWRQWLPIRAALRGATPLPLDLQYGAADLAVMSSSSMPEPGVVGICRPRLLLPEGIVERLTSAQLRTLIEHERCHIRCHDNLIAAIHMAVEMGFWFHPVTWWIGTRLVDERERACDEAVLKSGNRPQDYAEGILEVCRQSVGLRPACVAGVSGSNLRARVEAIMRNEIGRPMTRARRCALAVTVVAAVCGPVAGGALTAQSQVVVPPAGLAFEVASMKAGKPYPGLGPDRALEASLLRWMVSRLEDGRFKSSGPLHSLIQGAYNVTRFQIEGGPSWVFTDRYDLEAKAAGNATPLEIRGMLQSLLADRFKLMLRRETRTLPVYELVTADGGLKIAPMKEGECITKKALRWDLIDLEAPLYICDGARRRILSQNPETRPLPRWPRVTRIEAGGTSISALIDFISPDVDRVVIDRTGFTTPFNLTLDFASPRDSESSGPTLFTAMQEQLGLQLRSASGAVDVFVIDRVERPSEN